MKSPFIDIREASAPAGDPRPCHWCMPDVDWPAPVGEVLRPEAAPPARPVIRWQPAQVNLSHWSARIRSLPHLAPPQPRWDCVSWCAGSLSVITPWREFSVHYPPAWAVLLARPRAIARALRTRRTQLSMALQALWGRR